MMQKSVRYNAIAAIIPASFLSVVFLFSAAHYKCCASQKQTCSGGGLRARA
jgi:hypothetical protein